MIRTTTNDAMFGSTAKKPKLISTATTPPSSLPLLRPPPVLPYELIIEILLRLPVRFLLQLKCVCKSWKTLISDPQFAKDHLRISTADPNMTHHHRLVSSTLGDHCKITSCSVKSLFQNPSTPASVVSLRMRRKYHILGSCNGLLCLYDIYRGYCRLWNPSTRLRSKRSPIGVSSDGVIIYYGFGYDPVNEKYKVVVVVEHLHHAPVTRVHTFGTYSWTTIQDFPCTPNRTVGKFVSGTLNWLARADVTPSQWVILSLDLGMETYSEVLLPENVSDDDNLCSPVVDVFRNCLCVFLDYRKTHWVVWLMKEYGVHESWTKLMMMPHVELHIARGIPFLEPLWISEDGVVLARSAFSQLILYNPNDGSLNYPCTISKLGLYMHMYHESLVSPEL